jgi:small subunit ribosomal protein S16
VSTVRTKEPKAAYVADEKKKPVLKPKAEKPAAQEAPAAEAADSEQA